MGWRLSFYEIENAVTSSKKIMRACRLKTLLLRTVFLNIQCAIFPREHRNAVFYLHSLNSEMAGS